MLDTKTLYDQRVKRFHDAVALKEPDRVPILEPGTNTYPYYDAGYTMAEVLYDLEKAKDGIRKYLKHYQIDSGHSFGSAFEGMGPMLELSQAKNYRWAGMPGNIVPDNSVHQFIEYALLESDEVPDLVNDEGMTMLTKLLPAVFGLFEPFEDLDLQPSFVVSMDYQKLIRFFTSDNFKKMQEDMAKLVDLWDEYFKEAGKFAQEVEEMGFPIMAPSVPNNVTFDYYSDVIRGTMGASMDLYEHPDVLFEFLNRQFERDEKRIRETMHQPGRMIFIPMHKGMDGFLSDEHYNEFYWYFLEKLVNLVIELDMIPYVYTEGKYTTRLKFLEKLPKGKTVVHFEEVDMQLAKDTLGDIACLSGNFPYQLLASGTKEEVVEEAKRLLDICMPGGGYIFDLDGGLYEAPRENVEALVDTIKEYGKY